MRITAVISILILFLSGAVPARASVPESAFVFPQDPAVTTFTSTFHASKPDGRVHEGIDLMAPKLSPVFAVADGVITKLGDGPRSGNIIMIDHGNGFDSWYMHLNNDDPGTDNGRGGAEWAFAPGLEEGSTVLAGQFIGYVGDSGNAEGTDPHTHFELHFNNRPINPYPYLLEGWDAWWDEAITLDRLSNGLMEEGVVEFFLDTRPNEEPSLPLP